MKVTIVDGVREAREAAGDAPFRAPHHSVHDEGLVGEIALATGGVLFLDELDAFDPYTLRKGFALLRSMRAMGNPHTPRVFATVGGSTLGGVLGVLSYAGVQLSRGAVEQLPKPEPVGSFETLDAFANAVVSTWHAGDHAWVLKALQAQALAPISAAYCAVKLADTTRDSKSYRKLVAALREACSPEGDDNGTRAND